VTSVCTHAQLFFWRAARVAIFGATLGLHVSHCQALVVDDCMSYAAAWRALSRTYDSRGKPPPPPPDVHEPRRAYVTLLARGSGTYVSPSFTKRSRAAVPDYVRTAAPMLCSLRRVRSHYPVVVLAHNLTDKEEAALRLLGVHQIYRIPHALAVHDLSRSKPRSCLLQSHGAWQVWGRGDVRERRRCNPARPSTAQPVPRCAFTARAHGCLCLSCSMRRPL
jgi:hypothetical protein